MRKVISTANGLLCLLLVAGLASGTAMSQTFTDVSANAGLVFDPIDPDVPIGAGAAWGDLNGDGRMELVLARNGVNMVLRNVGDGTFTDVTAFAGLGGVADVSHSVTIADYDNDGHQDLFFGNNGQNRLYRNLGAGQFEDRTAFAGMDNDARNTSSSSWADYDNDGFLDLFVVNYVAVRNPAGPPHTCAKDQLFHNNGDGTFTDVAEALGVAEPVPGKPGCGLATTWSDYDDDGDQDLFVINDYGQATHPNVLYRNDGPGAAPGGWVFTDVSASSRANFEVFGMGIAVGDLQNDGDLDFYTTHGGPNKLAWSDGRGGFDDIAKSALVETKGLISWGCTFDDFDLDKDLDLLVANGNILGSPMPPLEQSHLYSNNGNLTFTERHVAAGLLDDQMTRSAATADFDDDGDIDIFLGNVDGTPVLYRNNGVAGNNYLTVRAEGVLSNRDAIGARIRVLAGGVRQQRELNGGSSFLSMNAREAVFGLGTTTKVDTVEVTYPSGIVYTLVDQGINQTLTLLEPTVTIMGTADRANAVPGSVIRFVSKVTNFTDQVRVEDIWHGVISPSGGTKTLRGPITVTLDPGEVYTDQFTLSINDGRAKGPWRFLHRVGSFGGGMIHQSVTRVVVD